MLVVEEVWSTVRRCGLPFVTRGEISTASFYQSRRLEVSADLGLTYFL